MKVLVAFSALCAAVSAVSDPHDVHWTTPGSDCKGGEIIAGEFRKAIKLCEAGECGKFQRNGNFSLLHECAKDVEQASAEMFKDAPYSIVQLFRDGSNCEGSSLTTLVARAGDECNPVLGLGQDQSRVFVRAVRLKIDKDMSATWTFFRDEFCQGEIKSYDIEPRDLGPKRCVSQFLKVHHIGSASASDLPSSQANGDATPAPTTKAVAAPAKTPTGAASTSTVGQLVVAMVFAVCAAVVM